MYKITKALDELKAGQKGYIIKINAKGPLRRRIMEMGIVYGSEITIKGFAPLGDPMELSIKGYNLSMRKAEAAKIIVELEDDNIENLNYCNNKASEANSK